jgi:hypothetical protein
LRVAKESLGGSNKKTKEGKKTYSNEPNNVFFSDLITSTIKHIINLLNM